MDELEKHIRSVRNELDIHEPGPDLWKRIGQDLSGNEESPEGGINRQEAGDSGQSGKRGLPGRRIHMHRVIWRAAVAVIVAGVAITVLAGMLLRSQNLNDPQVAAVRETYRYYDEKIRTLYEEAEPLLTANPDINTELTLGLNELDSLSAQIIRDLDDNIASSEVIEALIGNYRLRIELLEDMLSLMKETGIEAEIKPGNEL
jgi:hypothetical protein